MPKNSTTPDLCYCEPCPCFLLDRSNLPPVYTPTHPDHRAYGYCEGVWPNCPTHGVCSECGAWVTECTCVGGPSHD